MDTRRGAGPIALCRNPFAVFLEYIDDPGSGIERLIGRICYAREKEIEPVFPCPMLANQLK